MNNSEDKRNARILIIDDNRSIHDDFRKILNRKKSDGMAVADKELFGEPEIRHQDNGFEVSSAYQGEEGLEMVKEALEEGRPYALAFVDVRMPPGLDGIETIEKLWKLNSDLQVVICTAHSDYSHDEIITRLGQPDRLLLLKKPYDNIEVIQLAAALTEKWRLMQSANARVEDLERMVKVRTQEQQATLERLEASLAERKRSEVEQKRLEDQLRHAQKMEAIGQLAGGMAHDFNNLLMVINGYTDMLLESEELPAKSAEILKEIYSAGERASNLTRQLLTFSRKKSVRMRVVDLNETVTDLVKMLRRLIGGNIRLPLSLYGGFATVLADAGMIEQTILNLALNARDAMPRGGQLTIRTEMKEITADYLRRSPEARVGRFVRLSVEDTGCGMTPDVMSHLFEPFFTTKPPGKGSGLGLATIFGIVKQHQGWIEVESTLEVGTTFSIFLPATTQPIDPGKIEPVRGAVEGAQQVILMVEGEEPVRNLAVIILRRFHYQVLEAGTGSEALEIWESDGARIDVLITEMVMPGGMTGRELAEKLQSSKPSLKVIYTSGYSRETIPEGLRIHNKVPFLQKPYLPSELSEALRACFDPK